MTLFRSDNRSIKYISMAGDLRSCGHQTGVKRTSEDEYRALDHHAPVSGTSVSNGFGAPKRPRSSSSSSSSTCSAVRFSRKLSSPSSKTGRLTSRGARLRVEELRCIKSELKVIKNQIDELLNRLEHMDTQSRGPSGPAHVSAVCVCVCVCVCASEGRLSQSPVNRAEGSSRSPLRDWLGPEAGEASSEERQTKSHKLYYI
ncbi:uncharacterized protein LOC143515257 isoform X1 [Brachyhypopomus gauderio]|uniref:uncharacterized protein LOC143515257 isoform X1 n=1 Tax=Brachyhypopomus gauderio TaxID=698409 RepID=UPI004042F425